MRNEWNSQSHAISRHLHYEILTDYRLRLDWVPMSGKYECLMRLEGFKVNIGLFNLLLLVAILSCMDDTFTNNTTAKGTFISIRGIGVQSI